MKIFQSWKTFISSQQIRDETIFFQLRETISFWNNLLITSKIYDPLHRTRNNLNFPVQLLYPHAPSTLQTSHSIFVLTGRVTNSEVDIIYGSHRSARILFRLLLTICHIKDEKLSSTRHSEARNSRFYYFSRWLKFPKFQFQRFLSRQRGFADWKRFQGSNRATK